MCFGSDDDYYHASPYRPENEHPHPSVSQVQPRPRYQPPSREEEEKRLRQTQATVAAQKYGWPTSRGVANNIYTEHYKTSGNRDSLIEPDLAGGLASLPGSDYRAVYDPQRRRQPQQPGQRQPQLVQRPNPPLQRPSPPQRPQRPPYYQQRSVYQKPSYQQSQPVVYQQQPPMSVELRQNMRRQQPQAVARKPALRVTPQANHTPMVAHLIRRDSNGVSECSDDDDDDHNNLRHYTVSPIQASPGFNNGLGLYSQMGMSYGRNGAF
ncbi:hypothetical protein HD806DRAFT_279404 [Xylariaceae sp. AK1471]|nr:hypothetical protein HD806DRAFT_279404 [Xylariaceae sp. AK1471]